MKRVRTDRILPTAILVVLALLPSMHANAGPTPHVWLHYDYLVYSDGRSEAPDPSAIQMVVDAYAAHGIVLHIDNQHARVAAWTPNIVLGSSSDCTFPIGPFMGYRQVLGVEDVKAQYFHPTANHEWHYALFGGSTYAECGSPMRASGVAEINGDNFIVAMDFPRQWEDAPTRLRVEASTFMHELGHNLGLRHGGSEDTNYKPNYLSVMNYSFPHGIPYALEPGGPTAPSFTGGGPKIAGYRLDYSELELPLLDVRHLDETAGIGAGTTDITTFFIDKYDDGILWAVLAPASGPIDWNVDGAIDTDVAMTLFDWLDETPLPQVVTGHDDWSAVRDYILGTIRRGPKTIAHEDAAEQPQVTGLSPSNGPAIGGTEVTITGVHLRRVSQVLFDRVPATSFSLVDEKTLIAVSPPLFDLSLDRTVHVTVIAADNPSPSVPVDQFSYISMRPMVTSVSPSSGLAGIEITLRGSNFTGVTQVQFVDWANPSQGARDAEAFRVLDDQTIVARTPSCCLTGRTSVVLTNSFGAGGGEFTFIPPPSITSIAPASGPATGGTQVTIRGAGFTGAAAVSFGNAINVAYASFTVIDDSTIVATSPPWPFTGSVEIQVLVGSGPAAVTSAITPADRFVYQ